ncbi:MAG: indolepyruvate oxidoreductase subunit beta [Victivallaceae bacterium]
MKDKITNILMIGVGGQGTVLSSNILSLAAMFDGHDVKKNEIHGMSQRGGSVFSHVRFGKKVYSPVIPEGEADVLFSLEEIETLRWLQFLKPDGSIICLDEKILPSNLNSYPEGTLEFLQQNYKNIHLVDPQILQKELNNVKVLNVALLGALSKLIDISGSSWIKAIREFVPAGTEELNIKAFEAGKQLLSYSKE